MMVKYTSRYAELIFYVNNKPRRFSNGKYKTESKAEQAVLDKITDAKRVDEPAPKEPSGRKTSEK